MSDSSTSRKLQRGDIIHGLIRKEWYGVYVESTNKFYIDGAKVIWPACSWHTYALDRLSQIEPVDDETMIMLAHPELIDIRYKVLNHEV